MFYLFLVTVAKLQKKKNPGFETFRRHQNIKNENTDLEKMYFVDLCCITGLQCTVKKTQN